MKIMLNKTTYSVTLTDGTVVTRKSARVYTHAVVAMQPCGERVWAFAASEALATKRAKSFARVLAGGGMSWIDSSTRFEVRAVQS